MDSKESTLTPAEFEALRTFRDVAVKSPGEWIPAYRLAERSGKGGRLSQALRRLAKKGVIRQHPESDHYFRLPESEEHHPDRAADGRGPRGDHSTSPADPDWNCRHCESRHDCTLADARGCPYRGPRKEER